MKELAPWLLEEMFQVLTFEDVRNLEKEVYWPVFMRQEVCFVSGNGEKLYDISGRSYIDYLTGVGVVVLGHSHPRITAVIRNQAEKLTSCSNIFYSIPQLELGKLLSERLSGGKWFFSNSGAEANEAAIKLARKYGKKSGRYEIITALDSFHGRTLTTLTATGQPEKRKPFEPVPQGFIHVPFNNFEALKKAVSEKTLAVMIEPIQGERGVYPCDEDYLRNIYQLCRERNILLILDEVQTGLGRTGRFFGYEHFSIQPDILTLAKGMANGIPIGAVWARDEVVKVLEAGDHGSTYGGNAFATRVASEVLKVITEENLVDKVRDVGDYFLSKLSELRDQSFHEIISEVRGRGFLIGMEFARPVADTVTKLLLEKGFVVGKVGEKIIRFLPPYIIEKEDIDELVNAIENVLIEVRKK